MSTLTRQRRDPSRRPFPQGLSSWRSFVVAVLLAVGACRVGPEYERPQLDVPASWRGQETAGPAWPSADWWRAFGSPQLDTLIAQAETGNLDLAAAEARVREADALVRVAGAALLPSVGATTAVSGNQVARSTGVQTRAAPVTFPLYSAGLSASYEIDFWGANRASLEAAKDTALANRFAAEVLALTTAASVATTYFQVLELRDQIATTQRDIDSAKGILSALEAQASAGTVTALAVAQQQTTVLTLEAEIPPLREQLQQFTDALAILVGQPPEAVDIAAGSLSDLSHPTVAPGLPSELLTRRPDVAEAEAQLKSANANITVARAAFFPTIQLTGQAGFESTALSSLFGPASLLYSLAAGVTQPIFEGGALEGKYEFSKAFYDELLADYRKSVIAAFQDVEDMLAAYQQTTEQEKRQQAAVDAARQAYDAAAAQLRAGTVNVLTVLNTETMLFTAETTLVQVRLSRLNAIVGLYRALGGGWQVGDSNA